jgi:DNA-directed RNA polymerase specialized sigma24 family protein
MQPDLDQLYDDYAADKTDPYLLRDLLEGVRLTVANRYRARYNDCEDIAQMVSIKCWRSLPGFGGSSRLKTYDPARGGFNAFISTMARTTVIDAHRYDRLVPMADRDLERLSAGV